MAARRLHPVFSVAARIPAPAPATPAPAAVPVVDNRITIDDFLKVDLRVARVLAAEKVPNSRKLMKLSIDVGTEQRTLVHGDGFDVRELGGVVALQGGLRVGEVVAQHLVGGRRGSRGGRQQLRPPGDRSVGDRETAPGGGSGGPA